MNLQDLFYTVAIIFMMLAIGLILLISIIFYLTYKKISDLHDFLTYKIGNLIQPAEIAVGVGARVAETALKGVKKIIDKNK